MPDTDRHHVRVAIVGAGPAGIGVAVGLARAGVRSVVLIERASIVGGVPAKYAPKAGGVPTFVAYTRGRIVFGQQLVALLAKKLERTQTECRVDTHVLTADRDARCLTLVSPHTGKQVLTADAVVLACGAREKSRAERGWIAGSRPARLFHTLNLLELLDEVGCLPLRRPAIIGSDLIAFSAAAKLEAAGAQSTVLLDQSARPQCSWLERLYFRRWCDPQWQPKMAAVDITGNRTPKAVQAGGRDLTSCDGVVFSGELIPNSELAVSAGLNVAMPDRKPILSMGCAFSTAGWFAAGNIRGGFHGAQWCYFHGLKVARTVAAFLSKS